MKETLKTKELAVASKDVLAAGWIPIESKFPSKKQRVYVVCKSVQFNGDITWYQTMAEYIPPMEVKEEDFMSEDFHEEGDYDENNDEYYTPSGFYEWQSEPDTNWKISTEVTHWMPLFGLPSTCR